MNLEELIGLYPKVIINNNKHDIKHITIDSRTVKEGSLFVCIDGLTVDGHTFVESAIDKGATSIVAEKDITVPDDIDLFIVDDTKKALCTMAANFYDHPAKELVMIGVTGTNGKTSITYYLDAILKEAGKSTGVIGTNGATVNGVDVGIEYATSTTPDTIELHAILRKMKQMGADIVVMETTSHALALDKLLGIPFEYGIFTNFTQDHLDFHHTMEEYKEAKLQLFRQSKNSVINIDDPIASEVRDAACVTAFDYSIDTASNFMAKDIKYHAHGSDFAFVFHDECFNFHFPVAGKFSIYNALAAISTCLLMNIPIETCQEGICNLKGVPGRFESIENDLGIGIIVDYAHTADSLISILDAVSPFTKGKTIAVFGCGGDRDKSKRPEMGKAGTEHADFSFLTADNPRSEDPLSIIDDMLPGIDRDSSCYMIEADRELAIKEAIYMAEPGDTIVIAGKGHEEFQERKNKEMVPFDDRVMARKYATEKKKTLEN